MTRRIAVLGSTGSIGTQALEIIDGQAELELHSILCGSDTDSIIGQRNRYGPLKTAVVAPAVRAPEGVLTGPGSLREAILGSDMVLNAIVGSAGLEASLICRDMDIPLALANKESLVVGGALLEDFISAGRVIPVDSEHSTIFRCLSGEPEGASRIILTASGGSARYIPLDELDGADAERILEHPTWNMGSRITVDSATMVNKAFEVIEAGWLFGHIRTEAVIHPQSIVHSFIRLGDGSWKAIMGQPDMKLPLQYALRHPGGGLEEIATDTPLDWGRLEFEELDRERYPAFDIVVKAGKDGGTAPAAANAADEVAVKAFLEGRIRFGAICTVIEEVLASHENTEVKSLELILDADRNSRELAEEVVRKLC